MDTLDKVKPRDVAALFQSAQNFADEIHKWEGESDVADMAAVLFATMLRPDERATLIFQGLTAGTENYISMELGKADTAFAKKLAETIGPDYAQWLYQFSVLVTKLA